MSEYTDKVWENYQHISDTIHKEFQTLDELTDYKQCTKDLPLLNQHKEHYLFVYDTCKTRLRNHHEMEDFPLVAVGTTQSCYQMFLEPQNLGAEAIVMYSRQLDTPMCPVYGEIYKVPPSYIREKDWHESNQYMCTRIRVPINAVDNTGAEKTIYCYFYLHRYSYWMDQYDRLRYVSPMNPKNGYKYYNFIRPMQGIKKKAA